MKRITITINAIELENPNPLSHDLFDWNHSIESSTKDWTVGDVINILESVSGQWVSDLPPPLPRDQPPEGIRDLDGGVTEGTDMVKEQALLRGFLNESKRVGDGEITESMRDWVAVRYDC